MGTTAASFSKVGNAVAPAATVTSRGLSCAYMDADEAMNDCCTQSVRAKHTTYQRAAPTCPRSAHDCRTNSSSKSDHKSFLNKSA